MLAARIDRLPTEDKRLLQVASVIGKDLPFALLEAIADLPNETLRRGLNHLQVAEFLYETGLYPDLEYAFKHALTHEVTYGGLLQERRRARLTSSCLSGARPGLSPRSASSSAPALSAGSASSRIWL